MSVARRYILAAALCAMALGLSLGIERFGGAPTYVLFVAAVAVAAWRGGRGPALLASAIAVLAIDYFILAPTGSFELMQPEQAANSIAFLVVTAVVSSITSALREARRLAERTADRTLGLQRVTAALSGAMTTTEVSRAALTGGRAMLGAEAAALLTARNADRTLHLLARGAADVVTDAAGPIEGEHALLLHALRSGEPSWDADVIAIPLREREAIVGAMSFSLAEPLHLTAAERALVLLLGEATATALARADSYDVERRRRHEAELLAQAREEVLAVVAHDLRNPLHLIASSAELLAETEGGPEARRRIADVARRATTQMNRLIADLLDTARFAAGRLTVEREAIPVAPLFEQTEESFRGTAQARQIALRVQPTADELWVCADPGRALQVIGNLLGNALKFTRAGGHVSLAAQRAAAGDEVVFSVADDGPGIPADARERLFDRFWQARGSDRRGVGLGLAICKGIVEAHGGRIWCESEVGVGSTFFFTLPGAAGGARWTEPRAGASHTDPGGSAIARKQRMEPDLLPR